MKREEQVEKGEERKFDLTVISTSSPSPAPPPPEKSDIYLFLHHDPLVDNNLISKLDHENANPLLDHPSTFHSYFSNLYQLYFPKQSDQTDHQ